MSQLEIYDILKRRFDEVREEYGSLFSEAIPALSGALQAAGHSAIITNLNPKEES